MLRLTISCVSLAVIGLVFTSISGAAIDPATAVGVWLFDEGSGQTAHDSSGKGNDGTLAGGAEWVDGKFGKAIEFNGTDACVQTEQQLLDGLEEFSIVLWAWPGDITEDRVGLVGQNDAPEFGFINPATIQMWDPVVGGLDVTYMHPKKEWHHIAAVSSREFVKVYIDGEVAGEIIGNWANHGSSPFTVNIGGCGVYDPTGNWFIGVLDDVAIFHSALEQDDIKRIMSEGLQKAIVTIEGLIAYKERCFTSGEIDNRGVANSLDQKLEATKAALDRGQVHVAVNILGAFINEVEAQSGKHISLECADLLAGYAGRLISVLTDVPQAPSRRPIVAPVGKLTNLWGKLKAK